MFISDHAIRRPVATIVAMLLLVGAGIAALSRLRTDEFPDVQPPVVLVSIGYPGAAPDSVERELLEPVEQRIGGISDVDRITASALDSRAVITVQFVFGKNVQEGAQQIRDEIGAIRNDLPPEIDEPVLSRVDPADLPVLSLTLSSDTRHAPELTRLADPGITSRLGGIVGVAEVRVVGAQERQVTVELQPDSLRGAGVGFAQVAQALQAQNLAAPVGRINTPMEERTIRLRGRLERPQDFSQIVIDARAGHVVRLGDVALVRDGTEEARSAALFNSAEAVGIEVVKSKGFSTTAVADVVGRQVEEIRKTLPSDVQLRIVHDAGARVHRSVRDVHGSLLLGAVLTVLVVFVFLNSWRSTVITGVALPISVLASFTAVWALGFTLNTMSLLGLSLAIGVLIDDAIVVRENIVRHLDKGKPPYTAAREGTDEIGVAVTATTVAIIAVLVPVAFMGGVAEQWFAPLALTIACSVLVSWFVSFSLDPMLSAYWGDPRHGTNDRGWISRRLTRFNQWFDDQADTYENVVGWALRHRRTMIVLAVVSLLAGAAIPAFGIVGGAFLPAHDLSEFNVVIETPPGSSLAYTRSKADQIGRLIRARPDVAYSYTTIGGAGWNGSRSGAVNEGDIYIRLKPRAERDQHQEAIEREVRRTLLGLGGVTAWVSNDPLRNVKQIQVQVRGPDIDQLTRIGQQLAGILRQVPGAVDVGLSSEKQKPELDVEVDRALAGSLGVTVAQIAQALRPGFAGIHAGDWVDPQGAIHKVNVRLGPDFRKGIPDVEATPIPFTQPDGRRVLVPLGQLGRVTRGLGPARVDRLDRMRVLNVQANTENRPLTEVIADFDARARSVRLPDGYEISHGGEKRDQQGVFRRIMISLGVGVVLMYLVHVVQFGSFLDPLPVVVSLPLSLVGAMVALYLTGSTLNIMSMIGVMLLMGIVAKNAILLVDFVKSAERNGVDRRTAIIASARVRLRPILMTTFALTAGMLPVALGIGEGADFRAPLGRAVVGGVLTGTLLTLLIIPTAYEILSEWRDRLIRRFRRAAPGESPRTFDPPAWTPTRPQRSAARRYGRAAVDNPLPRDRTDRRRRNQNDRRWRDQDLSGRGGHEPLSMTARESCERR